MGGLPVLRTLAGLKWLNDVPARATAMRIPTAMLKGGLGIAIGSSKIEYCSATINSIILQCPPLLVRCIS